MKLLHKHQLAVAAFSLLLLSCAPRTTAAAQGTGGRSSNSTADIVGGTNETDIGGGEGSNNNNTAGIVDGTIVTEEVPGYVYIEDNGTSTADCGGQLIHPDIVLTAASCGLFGVGQGTRLLISALNRTVFAEERFVDSFVPHENFTTPNGGDNIAVIVLNDASSEDLTDWSANTNEPAVGDQVRVVGFGLTDGTDPSSFSPNMLETTLTMACARNETSWPCVGDLGGAQFDTLTNDIVGIAFNLLESEDILGNVNLCDEGTPLIMTRVSDYSAWIEDKICELSRQPPDSCPQPPTPTPTPPSPSPNGGIGYLTAAALAVVSAIVAFIIGDLVDDGCLFGNGEKDNNRKDSGDGWCIF